VKEFSLIEEKKLENLGEFQAWARGLEKYLAKPSIFLLKGELSAGKTELVRSLLAHLQASGMDDITSPTFALQHSYETSSGIIDHWDLYRLEGELESSGFWDQLSDPEICIFVEWPERLKLHWLPKKIPTYLIEIENRVVDSARRVRISKRP
jgi:tRNA threonylcarbamoyl adenosine modification protein YjeE